MKVESLTALKSRLLTRALSDCVFWKGINSPRFSLNKIIRHSDGMDESVTDVKFTCCSNASS